MSEQPRELTGKKEGKWAEEQRKARDTGEEKRRREGWKEALVVIKNNAQRFLANWSR